MSILGIIVALIFLIFFAYRGVSVLILSPLAAIIASLFNYFDTGSAHVLADYTIVYMQGAASFVQSFFPVFLLGAVFGKIMDVSGAAKAIAHTITKALGAKRAILSITLSCAVLTYGGVSLFVVVFAVYPIAAAIFRENDIPKRLMPAAIALGSFTFSMTALPGTPAIQNVIPGMSFGSDVFAAPVLGLIASAIMLVGGVLYLNYRASIAKAANEGYGEIDETSDTSDSGPLPSTIAAFLPIVLVIILNYIFSKFVFSAGAPGFEYLSELPYNTTLSALRGNWAVISSLTISLVVSVVLYRENLKGKLQNTMNDGANGSMGAILNTAVVIGFGSVIKYTAGFAAIKVALMEIPGNLLVSFATAVTTLAGVTGSASGGLSISMDMLAEEYMVRAAAEGISLEVLHRVASVAAGGLDSLPHCGAVITLLLVCGLNHKKSYNDIAVVSVGIPILATISIIILGSMGVA
jgi:H+/gluconate symporter-like permease